MRVLLVHPCATTRQIVRGLLRDAGVSDIAEASSGRDALAVTRCATPDALVIASTPERPDLQSFLATFQSEHPSEPVVVLTPHAHDDQQSGVPSGCSASPVDRRRLHETMRSIAHRRSAA